MIQQLYRHVLLPGFESLLKRRRTFQYWHELEQSQWWSPEQLVHHQNTQLRRLLSFCQSNSRWYGEQWKQLGIEIERIDSVVELPRLPILNRKTVRDRHEDIRVKNPTHAFVSKSTGGSSGTPLRLTISQSAEDRRVAATFRAYAWAGGGPGTKQSYLWGVRLKDATRSNRWKDCFYHRVLYRRDMLNSFELTDTTARQFAQRIDCYGPDVLVAYTGPLYTLSKLMLQHGWFVRSPQAIIVGAEKLHDFQRDCIERAFATKVFETYGSREFTLIGAECETHRGLHLTSENLIVEVVDECGRPAKPGEEGQILITDLYNESMPLVRYAIGDRGIAGSEYCECGRGLPLLRKVVGRELDVLQLADGKRIAGEYFPHLIKDFPAVQQFQVVQEEVDEVCINVVVSSVLASEESLAQLRDQVQTAIGTSARCSVNIVQQIELTSAGKSRVVIGLDADSGTSRTRQAS